MFEVAVEALTVEICRHPELDRWTKMRMLSRRS
jgi:hypothetical protein